MRFSVLQIVVAALLTQDVLFGALVILYLFTALGAMSLLFLHSEWSRHHRRMSPAPAPPAAPSRWPLAHQRATFRGAPTGRAPLGREIFVRLLRMGLATLLIAVVVFFAVPRAGRGAWRGMGGIARPTVGFSGRVRLGELGKIIQNPEEVMRSPLRGAQARRPLIRFRRDNLLAAARADRIPPRRVAAAGRGSGECDAADRPNLRLIPKDWSGK